MLDLSQFESPFPNVYVLKKWNWNYLEAQSFQLACVEYTLNHPECLFLLICSHEHCFTHGRGLQKTTSDIIPLVDFNPEIPLNFPLHNIKRGGGMTFHYPGQFIFYPIVNLTFYKKAVFDLMLAILEITKKNLMKQFNLDGLIIRRDLLGLWCEKEKAQFKLASIGLAVHRYNTYHGLALNMTQDDVMFNELQKVHPCGIAGKTYRNLQTLLDRPISFESREVFANSFVNDFVKSEFPI